ncbi:MAG: hypothetical protein Ct9H90mP16_02940 [Candidatus Poseidoniales archaeon]|nr:MAG: hypothetical protein Ct9H90mP16_02940 [Candidatus Poseidoniales archaeon]
MDPQILPIWSTEGIMVGFQVELAGFEGPQGRLEMFSGEEVGPGLFAWAIPNGETHRIGVWAHPDRLGGPSCEMLYDALRTIHSGNIVLKILMKLPDSVVHWPAGCYVESTKNVFSSFGGAAGLCKPTTGGGIGPGFDKFICWPTSW